MNNRARVCVREFARLTAHPDKTAQQYGSITDSAQIPESAFYWLLEQQGRFMVNGVPLLHSEGRYVLRLDNFVGVLASPCGTVIEVLPKTQATIPDDNHAKKLRALLLAMIQASLHLPKRDMDVARLQLLDYPLSEWLIQQFLLELETLLRKGLRFDYSRVAEENRFLRGQLDVARQVRQPLGREHLFQIRHDEYLVDRPENRLLKSALGICRRLSLAAENWRLAGELSHYLDAVPESLQPEQDFQQWHDNKLMQDYQAIRPWCELIVRHINPTTQLGEYAGISMLFPMERLFEDYVAQSLRKQFPDWQLSTQLRREYLCVHNEQPWFQLQPDLCLEKAGRRVILDTKWKLLERQLDDRRNKYGLNQADFYQLFAYGHKYLEGRGNLVLIYPDHFGFREPLLPFQLGDELRLWVLPFLLEERRLLGTEKLCGLKF